MQDKLYYVFDKASWNKLVQKDALNDKYQGGNRGHYTLPGQDQTNDAQ